jgi:deoxyribonuclease-4
VTERTSNIGRHLPTSGGLGKTLARADDLGCETFQIFVSNPQAWAVPGARGDAEGFEAAVKERGLYPTVAHAKYLINLASPKADLRERSIEALAAELSAAGELGLDLVVVHSGSHGGDGAGRGMGRLVEGLERARELAEASGRAAEPVVENSVGAGTQLCSTFDALGEVARRAGVRACVDTAHAFVAGYDLAVAGGPRMVAAELRAALGDAVALVHLNDAKNELGSHRDGHRKVGEGMIPEASWAELFAALPGVPFVMETPYESFEGDAEELRLVKELAGGLRKAGGEG